MSPDSPAEMPFPHLARPLTLRHVTLKHRITFGAHTANMSDDGLPGERHLHYYLERARGGAALIVTEPVPVHPSSILTRGNFRSDDDSIIEPFRRITDGCHEHGAVIVQQLYHLGQHTDSALSWLPNYSPSGLPSYHDSHGSHAMTEREVEEMIAAFIRAAKRTRAAGFDGVELFSGYNGLIDQFWAPWSNRRTDRFGGSRTNRMRFSDAIVQGIRRECGDDFLVGLALSFDPDSPILCPTDETIAILSEYDARGDVDYASCGTGSYFNTEPLIPSSFQKDMFGPPFAAQLKAALKHIRVQAESQVRTPANAETVVASGMADLVSLVRSQMADPQLANKALSGAGDQVRPCISCNQQCRGRRNRDYWISCLVNPAVGREVAWSETRAAPAPATRRVLVVGGGPAGLEVARTTAERGHAVTLVEASSELGGRYRLAGRQPSRERILEHLDWYERELRRLNVNVRTSFRADTAYVHSFSGAARDTAIVLATGGSTPRTGFQRAFPAWDTLPGLEESRTATVEEVLQETVRPTGRVLVLDELGNWQAAGTALWLQQSGVSVTLVTAAPLLGAELVNTGADRPIRRNFARAGGRVLTSTGIVRWQSGGAKLVDFLTQKAWVEEAEWLVVSGPASPEDALLRELQSAGIDCFAIGDCVAGRNAAMAIYEGRKVGREL